tara:strand:+ start:97 stop:843 length:747 start_codon:yes stop_codon:yes gene_type:complete
MPKDMMLITPFEKHRSKITEVLNKRYPNGVGVEIGVLKGDFSKQILENWNCSKYYLVDLWSNQLTKTNTATVTYEEGWASDEKIHNENYSAMLENTKKYKEKINIIRNYSHLAAVTFEDESLDFIYLDADHSYEGLKTDLMYWYPKLKKGGLIMGDDYHLKDLESMGDNGQFGVTKAVNEFCNKINKNVSIEYTGDWHYCNSCDELEKVLIPKQIMKRLEGNKYIFNSLSHDHGIKYLIPSRNWYFIK